MDSTGRNLVETGAADETNDIVQPADCSEIRYDRAACRAWLAECLGKIMTLPAPLASQFWKLRSAPGSLRRGRDYGVETWKWVVVRGEARLSLVDPTLEDSTGSGQRAAYYKSQSREGSERSSLTGCRRGLRLDEVLFSPDLREGVPSPKEDCVRGRWAF